jgi:adenylate cyclase
MERRLAAILAADVVGYTRLMGADEAGTLRRLTVLREKVLKPLISEHHGRIVKLMGDGLLVEFASAVDSVACAMAWQSSVALHEADNDAAVALQFRIGINLGDVIAEGGDIHGDGVNIAARLEGLAQPGGICLSDDVYRHAKGKTEAQFEDIGDQKLKNVADPVRVYNVVVGPSAAKAPTSVTEPLPLPDKPSFAVLPFTNMSDDPEQEYFSDGITEDIITELSRFRSLFVIARNSSFTYKGRSVKVQDVAKDLGVRFVVEGSVRKAGNRVRVTTQLIEASTGNHLWAERYDRDLEDIFAVQDEITGNIVSCLPGRLEDAGTAQAKRKRTASMTAYDYLLLGLEQFKLFGRDQNAEARKLFQKAIEIDPLYARAHALVASTYVWDVMAEFGDESLDEAFDAVRTALSLDHEDAWAHAILGFMLFLQGEDEEAVAEFQRAVALNANDADVAAFWANVLVYLGRWREALDWISKALRLNPHPPRWYYWYQALALFSGHRHEEAIKAIRQLGPELTPGHAYLAACYAHLNQINEAISELAAFTEAYPTIPEDCEGRETKSAAKLAKDRACRYRVAADAEHFLKGLRKAGFEV